VTRGNDASHQHADDAVCNRPAPGEMCHQGLRLERKPALVIHVRQGKGGDRDVLLDSEVARDLRGTALMKPKPIFPRSVKGGALTAPLPEKIVCKL